MRPSSVSHGAQVEDYLQVLKFINQVKNMKLLFMLISHLKNLHLPGLSRIWLTWYMTIASSLHKITTHKLISKSIHIEAITDIITQTSRYTALIKTRNINDKIFQCQSEFENNKLVADIHLILETNRGEYNQQRTLYTKSSTRYRYCWIKISWYWRQL